MSLNASPSFVLKADAVAPLVWSRGLLMDANDSIVIVGKT